MQNVDLGGGKGREDGKVSSFTPKPNSEDGVNDGWRSGSGSCSQQGCSRISGSGDGVAASGPAAETELRIVISQGEDAAALKVGAAKSIDGPVGMDMGAAADKDEKLVAMTAAEKAISRDESYHEQCRVCQQPSDEPLIDLGCQCRGDLAKAHQSCIEIWFRTRGSNKCEICQHATANVPSPEVQPSINYWIWRVDPGFGVSNMWHAERETGCLGPLWVALCILLGGLLLDLLISVSFGVSALPVHIIIGVLIVLGLGTALRLALECCHRWNMRRLARGGVAEAAVDPGHQSNV